MYCIMVCGVWGESGVRVGGGVGGEWGEVWGESGGGVRGGVG